MYQRSLSMDNNEALKKAAESVLRYALPPNVASVLYPSLSEEEKMRDTPLYEPTYRELHKELDWNKLRPAYEVLSGMIQSYKLDEDPDFIQKYPPMQQLISLMKSVKFPDNIMLHFEDERDEEKGKIHFALFLVRPTMVICSSPYQSFHYVINEEDFYGDPELVEKEERRGICHLLIDIFSVFSGS